MKNTHKQLLISLVTFVGGLYFFLEFLLPEEIHGFKFGAYHEQISRGLQVIGVMGLGLGLINVMRIHGARVLKGAKNWPNSFALIIGLIAMLSVEGLDLRNSERSARFRGQFDHLALFVQQLQTAGKTDPAAQLPRIDALDSALAKLEAQPFVGFGLPEPSAENAAELRQRISAARQQFTGFKEAFRANDQALISESAGQLSAQLKSAAQAGQEIASAAYKSSITKQISNLLSEGFIIPLGSTMFALLAFYIASAAYRSFRLRSLEATMMMIPALLVVLGQIPQGPLYISERLPALRLWLLQNISTPAFRAIYFGSAIAGLAMAVRMWLSLEKSPLAADDAAPKAGGGEA